MSDLFGSNCDIDKNAILNWRTERYDPIYNLSILGNAYIESANMLVTDCLQNNKNHRADMIVFPIFFSLNQGIELYSKAITWIINILLENNDTFEFSHKINDLWSTTKNNIEEFGFGIGHEENDFREMIKPLEHYLDELKEENIDIYGHMDFSRYPIYRKNGRMNHQFYVKEVTNVTVNLEVLKNTIIDISECLESLFGYYYDLYTSDTN